MKEMINALNYEVNFLTEFPISRSDKIKTIEAEFDFVQMCQKMIKPFGFEAKKGYLSGVSLFDLLNIYFIFSLADTVLELSN